jgi:hypothetical protein
MHSRGYSLMAQALLAYVAMRTSGHHDALMMVG